MRIQWSSKAVQGLLSQLERADQGLEACLKRAAAVRTALAEANPDGENRALKKAQIRFEADQSKLQTLIDTIEEIKRAIRRADAMFGEAEAEIIRLAENLGSVNGPPGRENGSGNGHINWDAPVYMTMPSMRVGAAPLPTWLETLTTNPEVITFLQ